MQASLFKNTEETTALLSNNKDTKHPKSWNAAVIAFVIIFLLVLLVASITATRMIINNPINTNDGAINNKRLIDTESSNNIYSSYIGYSKITDLSAGDIVKIKHFHGTYLSASSDNNGFIWIQSSCWTDLDGSGSNSHWIVEHDTSTTTCNQMPNGGYVFRNVQNPLYVLAYDSGSNVVATAIYDSSNPISSCKYLWNTYGSFKTSGTDQSDYRRKYTHLLNGESNQCISFNSGNHCVQNDGMISIGFDTCENTNSRRFTFEKININPSDSKLYDTKSLQPNGDSYVYNGYSILDDISDGDLVLIKTLSGVYLDAKYGNNGKVIGTCYYYSNNQLWYARKTINTDGDGSYYYFENYGNKGQYLGFGELHDNWLLQLTDEMDDYVYWITTVTSNDEKEYSVLSNGGNSECIGTYTFSTSCGSKLFSASCDINYGGVVFEKMSV